MSRTILVSCLVILALGVIFFPTPRGQMILACWMYEHDLASASTVSIFAAHARPSDLPRLLRMVRDPRGEGRDQLFAVLAAGTASMPLADFLSLLETETEPASLGVLFQLRALDERGQPAACAEATRPVADVEVGPMLDAVYAGQAAEVRTWDLWFSVWKDQADPDLLRGLLGEELVARTGPDREPVLYLLAVSGHVHALVELGVGGSGWFSPALAGARELATEPDVLAATEAFFASDPAEGDALLALVVLRPMAGDPAVRAVLESYAPPPGSNQAQLLDALLHPPAE